MHVSLYEGVWRSTLKCVLCVSEDYRSIKQVNIVCDRHCDRISKRLQNTLAAMQSTVN